MEDIIEHLSRGRTLRSRGEVDALTGLTLLALSALYLRPWRDVAMEAIAAHGGELLRCERPLCRLLAAEKAEDRRRGR